MEQKPSVGLPGHSAATVGRIVHYVLPGGRFKGEIRAALITRAWSPTCVNLCVAKDQTEDFDGVFTIAMSDTHARVTSVLLSAKDADGRYEAGTWHWPERE